MAMYNGAATLRQCLESVKQQTYRDIELIVIDGGSSDGSLEILKQFSSIIDYWESQPDRGIYHAWNKGLDHVTGDWVNFLGADDYFPRPDVLDLVTAEISRCSPDIRIVYGREAITSQSGEFLEVLGDPWEKIADRFMIEMCIPHTAVFHHASLFRDGGRFNEAFRIAGDYELLLRELKHRSAKLLPDVVVKAVRCTGVSKDWTHAVESVKEEARAKRMNGIFPYRLRWMVLMAKALVKHVLGTIAGPFWTRYLVDAYRRHTGRSPIWTRTRH